jgi:hypothetical protein
VNGIENRADGETMKVKQLYFEIYNKEKEEVTNKNSYVQYHPKLVEKQIDKTDSKTYNK